MRKELFMRRAARPARGPQVLAKERALYRLHRTVTPSSFVSAGARADGARGRSTRALGSRGALRGSERPVGGCSLLDSSAHRDEVEHRCTSA
jgi:hypothetical protein